MWGDTTVAIGLLILCSPICLHVALTDLRSMEIENYDVLAILGIFVFVVPFLIPLGEWAYRLAWVAPVLTGVFALTLLGAMGAGDAKFIAAMTPYAAGPEAPGLVLVVAVMTLVLIPLHRIFRAVPALRPGVSHWASWEHHGFPMGLVLGPSLLVFLALLAM